MKIRVEVEIESNEPCIGTNALAQAAQSLKTTVEEIIMTAQEAIDRAKSVSAAQTTVVESVIALLTQLGDRMREAADNPAEINAIADEMAARSDALAAAVVANTPAVVPPAP